MVSNGSRKHTRPTDPRCACARRRVHQAARAARHRVRWHISSAPHRSHKPADHPARSQAMAAALTNRGVAHAYNAAAVAELLQSHPSTCRNISCHVLVDLRRERTAVLLIGLEQPSSGPTVHQRPRVSSQVVGGLHVNIHALSSSPSDVMGRIQELNANSLVEKRNTDWRSLQLRHCSHNKCMSTSSEELPPIGRTNNFVFRSSNETPQSARNVQREFALLLERASLPHKRFHLGRNTLTRPGW